MIIHAQISEPFNPRSLFRVETVSIYHSLNTGSTSGSTLPPAQLLRAPSSKSAPTNTAVAQNSSPQEPADLHITHNGNFSTSNLPTHKHDSQPQPPQPQPQQNSVSHQWVQVLDDNQLSITLPATTDAQQSKSLLQMEALSAESQQSAEGDLRSEVEDNESGSTITAPALVWVPVSVLAGTSHVYRPERVTVQIPGSKIQRSPLARGNPPPQGTGLLAPQPSVLVKGGTLGGGAGRFDAGGRTEEAERSDVTSLDVCLSYSLACGRSCSRSLTLPVRSAFNISCQVGCRFVTYSVTVSEGNITLDSLTPPHVVLILCKRPRVVRSPDHADRQGNIACIQHLIRSLLMVHFSVRGSCFQLS